jgi:ribA/ribD-fused uncharacterized protein
MEQTFKGVNYKFFWNGILSNWYESHFEIHNVMYNCGEQYIMYQKALLFDDVETASTIINEYSPKNQKQLGRKVKNFNSKVWDAVKYELVKNGLREKFVQNQELKLYLIQYKHYQLVEASPYDRIWGIGFSEPEAIQNFERWGENLLGKILTELAVELY